MDVAALQAIDAGVKINNIGTVTATNYCVSATVGGKTWKKAGLGAGVTAGACP